MPYPIILHHFDRSPFSEKIRVVFGHKGLSWRSVRIPQIMPKPDLMPLTGGYRRTPVMQIGADVFCDTQIIIREIERRFPSPTLFPPGAAGVPWALSSWTDHTLFQTAVNLVFGTLGPKVPQAFVEDRSQLRGPSSISTRCVRRFLRCAISCAPSSAGSRRNSATDGSGCSESSALRTSALT
jgi:glutathione S-transferase